MDFRLIFRTSQEGYCVGNATKKVLESVSSKKSRIRKDFEKSQSFYTVQTWIEGFQTMQNDKHWKNVETIDTETVIRFWKTQKIVRILKQCKLSFLLCHGNYHKVFKHSKHWQNIDNTLKKHWKFNFSSNFSGVRLIYLKSSSELRCFRYWNVLKHWRTLKCTKTLLQLTIFLLLFLFQLYEINDDPKRKLFLDDLFLFMQKRGECLNMQHISHVQKRLP